MSDFYSLVYIKPNVLSDELILFGVLCNLNGKPHVYFSNDRLKVLKKFLKYTQIKALINSSQNIINEVNELAKSENSLPLFDHPYSESVIQQTASYKKNYFTISGPSEIMDSSKISWEGLVKELFNEKISSIAPEEKEITFRSKWLSEVRSAKHSMRRKFSISPDVISTIYSAHQIDLIGVYGEQFHCFHGIDFNSAPRTIGKNLFEFARLLSGLDEFAASKGMKAGKFFLVFEKPRKDKAKEMFQRAVADANRLYEFIALKDFKKELLDLKYQSDNSVEHIFNS